MNAVRLTENFFTRDVLTVAPELIGKVLVRQFPDGKVIKTIITEVEAYKGINDLACHASKGKTPRNEVMFMNGSFVYVYLIYGMYWMLNFVTATPENPQAVLIRGVHDCSGPGRLTRKLEIDKSFYGENLCLSDRIWVEDFGLSLSYSKSARIGVDYAGPFWAKVPWRFFAEETVVEKIVNSVNFPTMLG